MKFYKSKTPENVYKQILKEFNQICENIKRECWQGLSINDEMLEVQNYYYLHEMPQDVDEAQVLYTPDLPWAHDHLLERLSGEPLNPPPSHKNWNSKTEQFLSAADPNKFSHTYPERYCYAKICPNGSRYKNATLWDLIEKIKKDPTTRQAYLPMFMSEDISASLLNERVPCTLGYYFSVSGDKLSISYIIRSCDVIRHLHNDLYLTWGLARYVANEVGLNLGDFNFICFNLHCFANDKYTLDRRLQNA